MQIIECGAQLTAKLCFSAAARNPTQLSPLASARSQQWHASLIITPVGDKNAIH
jgi:hypothetical protein